METSAAYFDGRSSGCHKVMLRLEGDRLQLSGEGVRGSWPVTMLRLAPPLGSIRRAIYLPDGGKCEFDDPNFARSIEQSQGRGEFFRGVHRWENSLKLAFAALGLTLGLIWAFVQFGIPLLASRAAYAVPPRLETSLGEETLQVLDKSIFSETTVAEKRAIELKQLFDRVVQTLDASERPYRLELRHSPRIGANAFALPGGIVVLTDELVELAGQDEEVAAVLAHEVGHVRHRHAMRQVLQDSAVGLLVASLTGDIFSATSMAATLPTMLVDAKFSRDMEREADDVAVEYLARTGEALEHFAVILSRLEMAHAAEDGKPDRENSGPADYFSTHPATKERIERLRDQR